MAVAAPPPHRKFVLAALVLQLQYITCLRDLELTLPPAASLGETVVIECSYHLQGEELYTAKLYKGRHEFLQLVPKREEKKEPLKTFPLKGVNIKNVSLNGTGSTVVGLTVTLFDVNLFTTGLYGCEASADPSFHTELVRKHMTILVKPTTSPTVRGFKPTYRVGDVLNMTCSLADTFPAANLTWFFSGEKITSPELVMHSVTKSPVSGLLTSYATLTVPVRQKHFREGHMVGKCLANMLTMYWQSRDILLKEESPTLAASVVETNSNNNNNTKSKEGDLGKVAGILHHVNSAQGLCGRRLLATITLTSALSWTLSTLKSSLVS